MRPHSFTAIKRLLYLCLIYKLRSTCSSQWRTHKRNLRIQRQQGICTSMRHPCKVFMVRRRQRTGWPVAIVCNFWPPFKSISWTEIRRQSILKVNRTWMSTMGTDSPSIRAFNIKKIHNEISCIQTSNWGAHTVMETQKPQNIRLRS